MQIKYPTSGYMPIFGPTETNMQNSPYIFITHDRDAKCVIYTRPMFGPYNFQPWRHRNES